LTLIPRWPTFGGVSYMAVRLVMYDYTGWVIDTLSRCRQYAVDTGNTSASVA